MLIYLSIQATCLDIGDIALLLHIKAMFVFQFSFV